MTIIILSLIWWEFDNKPLMIDQFRNPTYGDQLLQSEAKHLGYELIFSNALINPVYMNH